MFTWVTDDKSHEFYRYPCGCIGIPLMPANSYDGRNTEQLVLTLEHCENQEASFCPQLLWNHVESIANRPTGPAKVDAATANRVLDAVQHRFTMGKRAKEILSDFRAFIALDNLDKTLNS